MLADHFADPIQGLSRRAVFLAMDSKKFKTERSSDLEFQKKCFYYPRGSHFLTFSVITEISGDILWYSDFAPALSQSMGMVF